MTNQSSSGRGGSRPGAGRKQKKKPDEQAKSYRLMLYDKHRKLISKWRKAYNLTSDSAALRHMIEVASNV